MPDLMLDQFGSVSECQMKGILKEETLKIYESFRKNETLAAVNKKDPAINENRHGKEKCRFLRFCLGMLSLPRRFFPGTSLG